MKSSVKYVATAGLLTAAQWALALQVPGPVVNAEWLMTNKAEVTVLDIRPNVKSFLVSPQYENDKKTGKKMLVELGGHIPDAVSVDPKTIRVDRMIGGLKVKFMIPERADFEKMARQWGVKTGKPVVIVPAGQEATDLNDAARLYWQFKVFGEDNIAIVNGGTSNWLAEGREVSVAPTKVVEGNWVGKAERMEMLATSDDVEKAIADKSAQLVDARNPSQYLGLTKKDTVLGYGHIPGAHSVSTDLLVTEGGDAARMLPLATYRDIFKMSGVDPQAPAIAYCNTGHLASGVWFVLSEVIGNKKTKLYDGSMHEWTLEKRALQSVERPSVELAKNSAVQ
jgi:thiosulfate/3-mercaptopyruvate sulfurtransferase